MLLSGLVLLTGCASMPSGGEVHKVGGEKHADTDPQVRVFGVKPQGGETPSEIVSGFLEATTSDEADYATAKLYLTEDQGKRWKPGSGITVLSGALSQLQEPGTTADGKDGDSTQITLTGAKVATVDDRHAYHAENGTFSSGIRLTKEDGEWRIAGVADGLVLSEADFQRFYRSVDTFYFAAPGPGAKDAAASRDALVADPIYLRKRINALSNAVNALLAGPTDWLKPVVRSEFPPGIRAEAVELDDSQRVTVKLKGMPGSAGAQCKRMAAQLIQTIQGMSSTPVPSVELQGSSGRTLCTLQRDDARDYAPDKLVGESNGQYFIDAEHHLVSLRGTDNTAQPAAVAGPLGTGTFKVGSAAVRRDEQYAAALTEDDASLYVTGLSAGAQLGPVILRSQAADPKNRLTTPSWDGYGDLWIADRDPNRPRLLMLPDGAGSPVSVDVPDLGDGRIESLRVAADGVRIALLVRDGDHTTLRLGRIERTGTAADQKITVAELRSVAPQLEDVIAASWAGFSRLAVVGREAGGVPQIQYVDADGSGTSSSSLPGISGVVSVAASERQDKPLLAELDGGVFRLPSDSNWKEVAPKAGSPVYPG
ncbi:LpqB family beta-propeller domain-containing protein [Actinacidiphila glaucinigra]|uniref:LpqB family beta-propeller domain-containing protein n=1 Tax=Actinacidiphila glaucinigra TaxID=235986 RepID=UPI001FE3343E|nr:LpqB family beta-propeller domain-containing protein [Actinacidiphila glaucinigra]